jgi:P4 family phage/plasmid primase-like protien
MSEQRMHPGAEFLRKVFGPSTEHPIYLCSLLNTDARDSHSGQERSVTTRDMRDVTGFALKWDRPARAVYYGVNTIKPTARRRCKENVAEINGLHADVDFKGIIETPTEARRALRQLMHPPTTVNFTGHGLHALWLFKEAIAATPESIADIEALLRLLADHVGADSAAAEVARLFRLPGTHNSKGGEWIEVITEVDTSRRYTLDTLRDWLEIAGPALHRKAKTNGAGEPPTDPFLALARRQGFHLPIDVEARLRDMGYQGPGESGIHATQLSVSASLLSHGEPTESVVATLLDATRVAAGKLGANWNWNREERAIRAMCETWITKHPELAPQQPAEPAGVDQVPAAEPDGTPGTDATPDEQPAPSMPDTARPGGQKKKKRRAAGAATAVTIIADGVIGEVRQAGCDLIVADGDLFLYRDGVWRPLAPADEKWLRVLIQTGAKALGEGGKLTLVNAAWRYLNEHPSLFHDDVQWDAPGLIALANGTLNLLTREFSDWHPEQFLRRKLAASYDAAATAPHFQKFMDVLFEDRAKAERGPLIELVQEFFGASLCVQLLAREQRRALFAVGPSRTGKTELARILTRLVGKPVASPTVGEISDRFGLQCFYGAQAWIRDDAVNEGDRLDPQKFKTIVTGEAIDIARKNQTAVRVELQIPILLTCNSLPTSRDASDAVFNRSLVLDLNAVVSEADAVRHRRQLGIPEETKLGNWLFDQEGPGILNWALDGLSRLRKRGAFRLPAPVTSSIQRFKDESNAVAEFARTLLVPSPNTKVERADLLCAFHGWLREEVGDDARVHGARWLIPKLRSACPWAVPRKIMGIRYFCGLRLTAEGLKFWSRQNDDATRSGRGSKGASALAKDLNKPWDSQTEADDDNEDSNLPWSTQSEKDNLDEGKPPF